MICHFTDERRCENFCVDGKNYCDEHLSYYNDQNKDECAICLTAMHDDFLVIECCKHTFHKKCLMHMMKAECPLCRGLFKNITSDLYLKILTNDPRNNGVRVMISTLCSMSGHELVDAIGYLQSINVPLHYMENYTSNQFIRPNQLYNAVVKSALKNCFIDKYGEPSDFDVATYYFLR